MENIKSRFVTVEVKGKKIKYLERYLVDENGEEIFNRDIEIQNDIRLYDEYKLIMGLLTSNQIKKIRGKYGLTQKEYALVLGMGEISVHRFEKGSIQTETVDNVMRLSESPNNLKEILKRQIFNIPEELYNRLINTIDSLLLLKEHAIIDVNNINLDSSLIETTTVNEIAQIIIQKYDEYINKNASDYDVRLEYISNSKLQKLLYYVQAYCLYLYNKKAFKEKVYASKQGPIIEGVQDLDGNCLYEGIEKYNQKDMSHNIETIIDEVINKYGRIETNKLIELCCNEEPYLKTKQGEEIKTKDIKQYFEKIYSIK